MTNNNPHTPKHQTFGVFAFRCPTLSKCRTSSLQTVTVFFYVSTSIAGILECDYYLFVENLTVKITNFAL